MPKSFMPPPSYYYDPDDYNSRDASSEKYRGATWGAVDFPPGYDNRTTIYIWILVLLCIFIIYYLNIKLSPILMPYLVK